MSTQICRVDLKGKFVLCLISPLKPSAYFPTPGLTFTNSTFCPHSEFVCFVWISEQTAIISLYNINRLGFTSETECVYCAVRGEYLKIIRLIYFVKMLTALHIALTEYHKHIYYC